MVRIWNVSLKLLLWMLDPEVCYFRNFGTSGCGAGLAEVHTWGWGFGVFQGRASVLGSISCLLPLDCLHYKLLLKQKLLILPFRGLQEYISQLSWLTLMRRRRMGKKSYYAKWTLNLLPVHDCMAHELKLLEVLGNFSDYSSIFNNIYVFVKALQELERLRRVNYSI